MKAEIYCTRCNLRLFEVDEEPKIVETCLLAAHATEPHCNHSVAARFTPVPGAWRLRLRCPLCIRGQKTDVERVYNDIPPELCSTVTIAYHSEHEGHALEIHVDKNDGKGERQIHPPLATAPAAT